MENNIEDYLNSLPIEVKNVIEKVLALEREKLELIKPRGIKDEIKKIIHEEIKQLEN